MLSVTVITLFPQMFPGPLGYSVTGRALSRGLWALCLVDIRRHGLGRRKTVDETPYGGGAGMVLRPDVVHASLMEAYPKGETSVAPGTLLSLDPKGRALDQDLAKEFATYGKITLLCGHYEGIDQRVLDHWNVSSVRVGDYITTGGELPAMILLDTVIRHLPGTLREHSLWDETFENDLLEYPQYTRPAAWMGQDVPEVLRSGHHEVIAKWRREQALRLTREKRPDLLTEKR